MHAQTSRLRKSYSTCVDYSCSRRLRAQLGTRYSNSELVETQRLRIYGFRQNETTKTGAMASYSTPVEGTSLAKTAAWPAPRIESRRNPRDIASQSTVPFPFRKNLLDEWSTQFHTFGTMGAKGRTGPYVRPGSSPRATTLFLGSGRPFDKAEAARLAAAERRGDAVPSDFPSVSLGVDRHGRPQRATPSVVKLTLGGLD